DFELKLSLCGGIVVNVSIANISDAYTRLLQSLAQNADTDGDDNESTPTDMEVLKPNAMFKIGQYFAVKVLQKSKQTMGFRSVEIKASLNPRDVYGHLNPQSLLKVPKMPVVAAVDSVEDHGYVMDIGFDGIKAFLPRDKAQTAIQEWKGRKSLSVGQLVLCAIDGAVNDRSVKLTTNAKTLSKFKLTSDSDVSAPVLMPGVTVSATVLNVSDRGLEVSVCDDFKGFVTRSHLRNDWEFPKNMYKIGDRVEGTVLYRHPVTKQFALSLKPRLEPKVIKSFTQTIKVGALHEKAVVMGRDDMGNVVFKLANGVKAIAHKKDLFDKVSEDTDLDNKYSVGSEHRCRVKSVNLMDLLVTITLKKSALDSPSLSIDDLKIGSIVAGKVKKLIKDGAVVQLGFGLRGFVPNRHLAETAQLKNREQLFPMGRDVKCRVVRLDKSCTPCKINLTCKKSLLSKKLHLLSSYEEAVPDFQTDGVVALIVKKGILVEFFNDVKGFIPLKFLSSYRIEDPFKVFKVGQMVKCSVVATDVDKERITCALAGVKDSKKSKNSMAAVGQLLTQMKVTNKTKNGFDLTDASRELTAFLPFGHLADDNDVSVLLSEALAVDDIIDEVVVFALKPDLIIVSRKAAFISCAKNQTFISSVDQLEPNLIVPVIINGFAAYGIFVEMAANIKGLVPKRYLIDGPMDEPKNLGFSLHQTVFARFVDFEEQTAADSDKKERKKLSFSLKLSHVWNNEDNPFDDRVQWFANYNVDKTLAVDLIRKNVSDSRQKVSNFRIGEVVSYRIRQSDDSEEVVCDVRHSNEKKGQSVRGLVVKTEINVVAAEIAYKVGASGFAVVVDIDFDEQRVVVVIDPKIVKQIKNATKIKAISCVKCEQIIKSTPIYICNQYVLVVLSGHAPGLLAYVPAKRHPNDISGISHLFSLTDTYHVIIKSVSNDGVIAVLKPHENQHIMKAPKSVKGLKIIAPQSVDTSDDNKPENGIHVPSDDNKKEKVTEIKSKQEINRKRRLNSESETESTTKAVPKAVEKDSKSKRFQKDVLKVSQPFVWAVDDATPDLNRLSSALTAGALTGDADHSSSDSDGSVSSEDETTSGAKPRKTRRERNEEVRHREELLRKKEEQLMDTDRTPETADDFERSALASPNSSLVWLKYVAYHLEEAQVDKAREVVERALKTISFREERERLNVWLASLNLEHLYGTQQTLDEVFAKAVQFNEPVVIYSHLADTYAKAGKLEESELLYNQMLKKFKHNKNVWIGFGHFYMRCARLEAARKLMQRALQCLEKREHLEVIEKFAQMEFRSGDVEYGKTLFENCLANFPKKVNLWFVYIDMMLKYGVRDGGNDSAVKDNDEMVRNIFERVITYKLAAKQMKSVFKRYIEFETQRDNFDRIDRIKHKAMEYVEGRTIS
ncbi:unnamed protein product, partial [Oppiella nova]